MEKEEVNCNTISEWIKKFEKMSIYNKQALIELNHAMQRMMLDHDMYEQFPEVHTVWEISNRVIKEMESQNK